MLPFEFYSILSTYSLDGLNKQDANLPERHKRSAQAIDNVAARNDVQVQSFVEENKYLGYTTKEEFIRNAICLKLTVLSNEY